MQNNFRHFCRHVRESGSATPATQNETFQPASAPSTRRSFSASSIDTATAKENQRIETRHVAASKQAFRARRPQIFTLCSFKIDGFLGVFSWTSKFATSKSMFRAMHPSIFIITQNNTTPATEFAPCHHLTQPWQCDSQKNTQHDTSEVLRLPLKMTMEPSKVLHLPRKIQLIFRHVVMKHVGCHSHACREKRGYATFETSKSDHFCRTCHRHSQSNLIADRCRRLPPIVDCCGRLRSQKRRRANASPSPDPQSSQSKTRTLRYGIRE